MKCPKCDETLLIAFRSGVEIDYCPKCRGVWLDRGELDKIIERAKNQKEDAETASKGRWAFLADLFYIDTDKD